MMNTIAIALWIVALASTIVSQSPPATVLDILRSNQNFSNFTALVDQDPALVKLLGNQSRTFTVFPPTNSAFNEMNPQIRSYLFLRNQLLGFGQRALAEYSVIPNAILASADIQGTYLYPTLAVSGLNQSARVPIALKRIPGQPNNLFLVNSAQTVDGLSDLRAQNGIVQGIDNIVTPLFFYGVQFGGYNFYQT
ncbi:hypothetical protein BKA69DRAFT_1123182 [Paraphysoderma sedebokerense]|nr:hypothetical protein BKA69DRAFT_1123182 [Paraphysoderma sedebokerense]